MACFHLFVNANSRALTLDNPGLFQAAETSWETKMRGQQQVEGYRSERGKRKASESYDATEKRKRLQKTLAGVGKARVS